MTPQILLDALKKAFLSFEAICFIILDECHRATGNHPYVRIMEVNICFVLISLYLSSADISYCFLIVSLLLLTYISLLNHSFLKEFYHKSTNRPKIFGMTASSMIKKGKVYCILYLLSLFLGFWYVITLNM